MSDINTATRLISVIDGAIERGTKSGANIEVTYGQVFGLTGGMEASVYLAGSRELSESDGGVPEPSEGFRVPAHLTVAASDYVRVAIDQRGHRWIDEVIPTSEYPKITLDVERGEILTGDGTVPPTTFLGGIDVQEDGSSVVNPATIIDFIGDGVDVLSLGGGHAVVEITGDGGSGAASYYKPVGSNIPGAITTDGSPAWVPLTTSDGDIVMVEILI